VSWLVGVGGCSSSSTSGRGRSLSLMDCTKINSDNGFVWVAQASSGRSSPGEARLPNVTASAAEFCFLLKILT
jgi:hypothetical protein